MHNQHAIVSTRLGDLTLVASGNAVIGVYFPHHWVKPTTATLGEQTTNDPLLTDAARQLDQYFAGERDTFDLPIERRGGDAFQQQVWALLDEIPRGETTTYGELAERLGDRQLAQLVGKAVGSNPLSVIVPCHRVVGKNGKLTGYAGGLQRKQFLLDLEEAAPARLF
ncbi:methylated-DNA--[protein]-cysteine S-methyltransferase [Kribbella sp. CA-294648]|uniref:methylated-DNA--[protein]-cysteine S-methyltransferase n=1 Tax=Kribbella sp. CA-294648 TaxID=3239948 RepID=UPI003D8BB760